MILLQYIQEVLFKQRVCVVPHLGTFMIQHFPAFYNTNTQTLTPPRDQIMFTQHWQDDGACVEWIALKENLVPAVAQRKLEKYIEELKEELKSATPLSIPGVGKLLGDFAGNVHFYPEELPAEFDSLDIAPIERESEKPFAPASSIDHTPPPTVDKTALEPIMTEEVENDLELVEEESGFKWWWAAVPAIIIIGGLAAWYYVTYQYKPVATTETTIEDTPAQQQVAAADTTAQTPADTVQAPARYLAVIKTFDDSAKAASYQAKQKAWGYPMVLYKRDSLYVTAIELLPDADTTHVLDSLRKHFLTPVHLDKQ
ncbi:hypothetical protein SAMN05660909_02074 [Chitinophaga terrae (ex Kim and Jung 2007)]|uniref:CCDC81-like prokaryotic HU domain-containing protein n=1 Tax=Chitinophaga terrae (ex Kim and Jung 2007) TaxID=408074 RepID=A0A1H4BHZ7_9BACT|nr:hypothetical protein [Chitinophaga terrae (ex Kim and Jung 2007)]GEP89566.1 hypothetical protein CTE07_12110 [Chitinophaga terrae (ex Kim and Jung 2007)]SEA47727.1 hypothetical protein SAMN05660909_02074 [Chitinophaga terrae (ex Kim and Jung 2007)]